MKFDPYAHTTYLQKNIQDAWDLHKKVDHILKGHPKLVVALFALVVLRVIHDTDKHTHDLAVEIKKMFEAHENKK